MAETEKWKQIAEFPNYDVSNYGKIYTRRTQQFVQTSLTNHGHLKVSLSDGGERHTRSVALLVARAFVSPPQPNCDHVMLLNGDLSDLRATNIVWRPRWYAWKYKAQLKDVQPLHYRNLPVRNKTTRQEYNSIIEAGITEGLVYKYIWLSTNTGHLTFPHGDTYEIIKRV